MSTDPTAFEIDFDPLTRRMRGYATHGNTYFDVPFVSEIDDNLWVGGCENGLILPEHIEHLVSLYPWEQYTVKHELASSVSFRAYDGNLNGDASWVEGLANWVNLTRKQGPTLVHCQAGLNRSSLIAAYALILDGADPDDAINQIREKRSPACLCNRSFETWLLTRGQ